MAGGPNALHVVCMTCAWESSTITKSTRISEGIETDFYRCDLGHEFGIDWEHGGSPDKPQWPPGPEYAELVTKPR